MGNLPAKTTMLNLEGLFIKIAEIPAQQLADMNPIRAKLATGGSPFIMVEDEPLKELNGVILAVNQANVFWVENEAGKRFVECESPDGNVPVAGDGRKAENCFNCPYNTRISKPRCRNTRVLYLLCPEITPLPVIMTLPPTSIGNWSKFCTKLSKNMQQYSAVAVKIIAIPDKNDKGDPFCRANLEITSEIDASHKKDLDIYREKILPRFANKFKPEVETE